jgi:hypothetical protein
MGMAGPVKFPNPHEHIDRVGLAMDRAIAAKIRADPSVIEIARRNLARWRQQEGGQLSPPHEEWERILRFLAPAELADFISSDTPKASRLRQSSPFPGVLSEEECRDILQRHA